MRISDWSSDVCSSDLLPRARSGQRVGWQFVEGAVQPAVPFGWHPARVVRSLVQHPAPLAVARQIIAVAKGVLAHLPAVAPVVQQRADGRAVPPGEYLAQDAHGRRVYRQAPALRKRSLAFPRPPLDRTSVV